MSKLILATGPLRQYHLLLYFVVGNMAYLWRHAIWSHFSLFLGCAILGLVSIRVPGLTNLASIPITYCTVYLGTRRIPKIPVLSKGDYSYGIYLYAYPIQQLVTMYLPHLRVWYINILLSLPLTVAVAAMSWHLVEAPALTLKTKIKGFAAKEHVFLSPYVIRIALATGLICYGIVMLHWSGLEAALQFSPRRHWISVIAGTAVLAALVASGRKFRKVEPAAA